MNKNEHPMKVGDDYRPPYDLERTGGFLKKVRPISKKVR